MLKRQQLRFVPGDCRYDSEGKITVLTATGDFLMVKRPFGMPFVVTQRQAWAMGRNPVAGHLISEQDWRACRTPEILIQDRRRRRNFVSIAARKRVETSNAIAIFDGRMDERGKEILTWLPKSQIEVLRKHVVVLPEWIAKKKGLA